MKRKIVPAFVLTVLCLLQIVTPVLAGDDAELSQVGDTLVLSGETAMEAAVEVPVEEPAAEPVEEPPEEATEEATVEEDTAVTDTGAEQTATDEPVLVPVLEEEPVLAASEELPAEEEMLLSAPDGAVNEYASDVKVVVDWTAVTGVYSAEKVTYTWDADKQSYTRELGELTETTAPKMTITLTNNSNVYENYTITYTPEVSDFTEAPESGSNTTGTLASYTAVNAVISQATGATKANTNMAGKNTATYTGTFTAENTLPLEGTGEVTIGSYKVTLSKPDNTELTYSVTSSKKLSASGLLAVSIKTEYTFNSKICYAYNGYIYTTADSNWSDAMVFVQMLNENGVEPTDDTIKGTDGGYWRLLSSETDASAWAAATYNVTRGFSGVYFLWSSEEQGTSDANYWDCSYSRWKSINRNYSTAATGFVVIWEQN